jgi:hypothetical protein
LTDVRATVNLRRRSKWARSDSWYLPTGVLPPDAHAANRWLAHYSNLVLGVQVTTLVAAL